MKLCEEVNSQHSTNIILIIKSKIPLSPLKYNSIFVALSHIDNIINTCHYILTN